MKFNSKFRKKVLTYTNYFMYFTFIPTVPVSATTDGCCTFRSLFLTFEYFDSNSFCRSYYLLVGCTFIPRSLSSESPSQHFSCKILSCSPLRHIKINNFMLCSVTNPGSSDRNCIIDVKIFWRSVNWKYNFIFLSTLWQILLSSSGLTRTIKGLINYIKFNIYSIPSPSLVLSRLLHLLSFRLGS